MRVESARFGQSGSELGRLAAACRVRGGGLGRLVIRFEARDALACVVVRGGLGWVVLSGRVVERTGAGWDE